MESISDMMESRCKEQLRRRREQARAHHASEMPELKIKRLDALMRRQKRWKPGCNR